MGILTDGGDISMAVLAEEIVKAILSENMLNEKTLTPKVTAILKSFIKKTKNIPVHLNKQPTQSKVANYIITIHKTELEKEYFKAILKQIYTPDEMKEIYEKLLMHLKEHGH